MSVCCLSGFCRRTLSRLAHRSLITAAILTSPDTGRTASRQNTPTSPGLTATMKATSRKTPGCAALGRQRIQYDIQYRFGLRLSDEEMLARLRENREWLESRNMLEMIDCFIWRTNPTDAAGRMRT